MLRGRPQDLPWTRLDLGEPIGLFTGRKLAALTSDYAHCRALLRPRRRALHHARAGVGGGQCGYGDAVRLDRRRVAHDRLRPAKLGIACPVAAALAMWEWNVVQPAAQRHFGARVTRIEHFGSYSVAAASMAAAPATGASMRPPMRSTSPASAWRTARAITVARDWQGDGAKAAFLREVRDGACRLFSTVLSPDYNAAHRDHLHLDQAERGAHGLAGVPLVAPPVAGEQSVRHRRGSTFSTHSGKNAGWRFDQPDAVAAASLIDWSSLRRSSGWRCGSAAPAQKAPGSHGRTSAPISRS